MDASTREKELKHERDLNVPAFIEQSFEPTGWEMLMWNENVNVPKRGARDKRWWYRSFSRWTLLAGILVSRRSLWLLHKTLFLLATCIPTQAQGQEYNHTLWIANTCKIDQNIFIFVWTLPAGTVTNTWEGFPPFFVVVSGIFIFVFHRLGNS